MRSYDVIVDAVVEQLDLNTTTKRREHLREDHLFVPNGFIVASLDGRLGLNTRGAKRKEFINGAPSDARERQH